MMGEKQPFLHLMVVVMVVFFLSCCILIPLSADALPSSLALKSKEPPAIAVTDQDVDGYGKLAQVIKKEVHATKEAYGRMTIEFNDYPGSGANNHHDPKVPPGRP